jgi:hypothetical protein
MRATVLTPLILLGLSLQAIGQSPARPSGKRPSLKARNHAASKDELKLVVALFRHGVRSPSPDFDQEQAAEHSKNKWPALEDWRVMEPKGECDPGNGWGYLTNHGNRIIETLGRYYGDHYKREAWSKGFNNVYLWADAENQRTRATAKALGGGFQKSIPSAQVTVTSLSPCTADPLFHPFARECGKPQGAKLQTFAADINRNWLRWATTTYASDFGQLYSLLDCFNKGECDMPLELVTDNADTCVDAKQCKSPLAWKGRFSYASSASEAFLLEYANNMRVGWGNVDPPTPTAPSKLREMLKLHEFYFDKTDRFRGDNGKPDQYLASIEGSNLSREILDQLKRKAGMTPDGNCPRATAESDFVGLIGHDTNLASVGALLELGWKFDDKTLPSDTLGLPPNDALPAGALVFELWRRTNGNGNYFVRIEYVTQSLDQMRNGPVDKAFRLTVNGPACEQKPQCEISLTKFEQLVQERMRPEFLSGCTDTVPPEQTCPATPITTDR